MTWFRLYFLDTKLQIAARDDFEAEDEELAVTIARLLYDACSDRSAGFELWRGTHRLTPGRTEEPVNRGAGELGSELQNIVLEREEILANSHWANSKERAPSGSDNRIPKRPPPALRRLIRRLTDPC